MSDPIVGFVIAIGALLVAAVLWDIGVRLYVRFLWWRIGRSARRAGRVVQALDAGASDAEIEQATRELKSIGRDAERIERYRGRP